MHLLALDGLLQDDLAALEVAARGRLRIGGDRFFAHVVFAVFKHVAAALGASAQGGLGAEVDQFTVFFAGFVVAEVELELVVLGLFVKLDDHLGHKRPAGLGAETVQGADVFVTQELLHLCGLEGAPRRGFTEREAAAFAVAICTGTGIAAVVFFDDATAVGARGRQGGVVTGDGVAVVFLGLFDHVLGHGGNLGHELFAAELALLHLGELVFPLAGELGLGQFLHVQAAQQRHELEGLGGGNQLAAFAQHVFLGNQAFDDAGAGGWCAQALLLHGFAQFVVFHGFAGTFHGAEQGSFGVACGRFGLEALGVYRVALDLFAGRHGHQVLALVAFFGVFHFGGGFFAVDGQPARLDQHLAFGLEGVLGCGGDARSNLVLRAGEEHRHEAAHHQVVQLLLRLAQAAGRLQGGDDRKVIRDLGVVEHALGGADVVVIQCDQCVRRQMAHVAVGQHLEGLFDDRHIVFGQGARIGTRVGQGLVALVQALGNLQGGLGRETKLAVGLALQAGQVKQQGRSLGGGLALFGHGGGLAAHRVCNRLGLGLGPDPVGLFLGVVGIFFVGWVEPLASVLARLGGEGGVDLPVIAADKLADQLFALYHH